MYKKEAGKILRENISLVNRIAKWRTGDIYKAVKAIKECFKNGGKLIIFGNGGSASDSLHMAAELVGRFKKERRALPTIALPGNISALTAIGNDYGFERIFERQIEAVGKEGDTVIGISTSGASANVIRGLRKAKKMGLKTIMLTGALKNGKRPRDVDICISVPSRNTPRVQEAHITIIHIICELLEK